MTPSCHKAQYESRQRAIRAARLVQGASGRRLWPYRCPRCPFYHLTSSPPRRTAR